MIIFDEFQNKFHKELDLNFELIETIVFTINKSKNNHFSHEKRMISRIKKTFINMNDNRDLHDIFSFQMRTRNDVFISNDRIRRFTMKKNSKNQTNNSLQRKIMLRFYFKYEYVTFNHRIVFF